MLPPPPPAPCAAVRAGPQPPTHPPSPRDRAIAHGSRDKDDEVVDVRPSWVTFENSAEVWYDTLKGFGADEEALQCLFNLAQNGEWGYEAANALVSKILRKSADGIHFDNISGFIHSGVINAWNGVWKKR